MLLFPLCLLAESIPTLEQDILPMFQKNCMGCHGGLKQKAGIDLRTLPSMLKGGEDGQILISGKPDESPLFQSVLEDEMPKGKDKLTESEKETLRVWIERGFPILGDIRKPAKPAIQLGVRNEPESVAEEIDRLIQIQLTTRNLPLNPLTSDAEFLRRVSLDLIGRIPAATQAQEFIDDTSQAKRENIINQLLMDAEFGNHLGRQWRDWIAPPELPSDMNGGKQPHKEVRELGDWFTNKFNEGNSWDKIVTELLNFQGEIKNHPQAIFYPIIGQNAKPTPDNSAKTISSLFMGIQIQCAQCHDDPYRDFAQQEFWAMSAFFSSIQGDFKKVEAKDSKPEIEIPKSSFHNAGKLINASFPKGKMIDSDKANDWRPEFSRWLTDRDNPFFAKAFVNRLWFQFMAKGLVNPIDDIRPLNPPSHPTLLNVLAAEFTASGYDIRHMIRCITLSETYQRSAATPPQFADAKSKEQLALFGRAEVRVMSTDQLHESLKLVLGEKRIDLRTHQKDTGNSNGESAAVGDEYLEFQRKFTCNEEDLTDFMHGIPQMLTFLNHPLFQSGSRALDSWKKENPNATNDDLIKWLYLATLSRSPSHVELTDMNDFIQNASDQKSAENDIIWMLLNHSEFIIIK